MCLCGTIFAGQATTNLPSFDVASVKAILNPPNYGVRVTSLRASLSHGTLTFEGLTFTNLILQAYDLQRSQIIGCPNWCDSEFFDVIGKAEDPNVAPEQVRLMLQALLMERFKLAAHREKRDVPGYALVVSKSGAKLKAAKEDEVTGAALNGYVRTFRKLPVAALVNLISNAARQPVIDNTGLKGLFDFAIDLTHPENDPLQTAAAGITATNPDNAFARLSAAVEEQLGLRLEPRRIPVENLIIDHAERPLAN
jgi:uncharacterized protein (TIGR03435 family)